MDTPTSFDNYSVASDIEVLPAFFPIPGLGIVPINVFLIRAAEPMLVDTGVAVLGDAFMAQLEKVIDPGDIKWLWLTHTDQDHIGSLLPLLNAAPNLRIITTFLGVGKMSLFQPLPMDRVYLLNPGQDIDVGDRTLTAIKPPTYDAPETTGFYDRKSGILYTADSFGALMSEPSMDPAEIAPEKLREGLVTWATVDAPWLNTQDRGKFQKALATVRDLNPRAIFSCHLPPAFEMNEILLQFLLDATGAAPFTGPDQKALEAMLAGQMNKP